MTDWRAPCFLPQLQVAFLRAFEHGMLSVGGFQPPPNIVDALLADLRFIAVARDGTLEIGADGEAALPCRIVWRKSTMPGFAMPSALPARHAAMASRHDIEHCCCWQQAWHDIACQCMPLWGMSAASPHARLLISWHALAGWDSALPPPMLPWHGRL